MMDHGDVARLIKLADDQATRDGIVVRVQAVKALGELGAVAAIDQISWTDDKHYFGE
jgi:hypothetical protein